jgi:hypothetical protein
MYFDQHEDGEGHGHHSLPPAPSEEQEMKNTNILTSTRMKNKCIFISVADPGCLSRIADLDFSIPDPDQQQ